METTSSSSSEDEVSSSECELDETSCDQQPEEEEDEDEEEEDDDDNEEDDIEKLETAKICGATLQLPQLLCESKDIFKEFFSLKTFNSLSEINKQHLKNFLPSFPENDEQEKMTTLQKLFNRETFRFNSPLSQFHDKLKAGHFRPDIARMRKLLKQEQKKEYRFQQKVYGRKTLRDLMTSRQRLLDVANSLPPGIDPKVNVRNGGDETSPRAFRAKRRYFQELAQIKSQVNDSMDWSEDENYPDGPPMRLSKKLRRHLNGLQNSGTFQNIPNAEKIVTSTLASKASGGLDLENSVTSTYNPYQLNEDSYRALLYAHKKRKHSFEANPELVTKGINIREIAQRTQLTPNQKKPLGFNPPPVEPLNTNKITKKKKPVVVIPQPTESESDTADEYIDPVKPTVRTLKPPKTPKKQTNPIIQETKNKIVEEVIRQDKPLVEDLNESVEEHPQISLSENLISPIRSRIIPASLSDLDGIDMMTLPVDLEDSNIDILEDIENIENIETSSQDIQTNIKQELLMQETHSNFLSLIRDIICSTVEHRMSLSDIEERLKGWQTNPISPLNTWYSLVDNWLSLLPSAIAFLTGEMCESPEDYVPYLEFKPNLHLYQWIGAGRDSDNRLNSLCQFWLEHRDDNIQSLLTVPVSKKQQSNDEIQIVTPSTPPPPRCPTNWVVRKAESQEVEEFREQERQRYANPHKAFTYKMNGYESIVGPVKGMYNQTSGLSKARGHSMLNADRPNFVTILTLVRDAVARLPNGEGTRADICELLKSSQYISHCAPENVLQSVVSGALDRLHTEYDPSVKYDTKKKIWIYLHRNRSEADFERIHQQFQGLSKQFKKSSRKNKTTKTKTTNKTEDTTTTTTTITTSTTTISTPSPTIPTIPSIPTIPTIQTVEKFKTPPVQLNNRIIPQTNSPTNTSNTTKPAGTSLLVNSNKPPKQPPNININLSIKSPEKETEAPKKILTSSSIAPTEQDIEKAIQTLTPIRVSSPVVTKPLVSGLPKQQPPTQKSLVKIINSAQGGKSLISPPIASASNNPTVFIKQIDSKATIATGKNILAQQPQITQQLLHTIAAQQKLKQQTPQQPPQPAPQIKQPIIVTTQQLVKSDGTKTIQTIANAQLIQQQQQLLQAINQKQAINSQQQILQTIKQKVQSQQSVLTLQQAINKQANIQQLQKQIQQQQTQQLQKGTSLLGQQRIITQATSKGQNQTPLVAKVLTNAAGQVISVESLLAHQKQHGTLPSGTTLRVSGAKPGQTNLIQLSGTSANQIQQFAVVSQNNLVRTTQQTVTCTTSPANTSTVPSQKTLNKSQIVTKQKFLPNQLVNAKFVNNKLIPQQKIVQVSQPLKINATVNVKTNSKPQAQQSNVRMVNTTGLNLASFAGKPILLASKGQTIQNLQSLQGLQGQNVILQTQSGIQTSNNSIVLPNNARVISQGGAASTNVSSQPSNFIKVQSLVQSATSGAQTQVQGQQQQQQQPQQQIVLTGQNLKAAGLQGSGQSGGAQTQTVVLGGAIKMAGTSNRVVLASQGSSGQIVTQQILLPSNFQGGAINIKTLQGLKVIPLAQTTQQTKGRPQVFARIMNPQNARITTQVPTNPQNPDGTGTSNANNVE